MENAGDAEDQIEAPVCPCDELRTRECGVLHDRRVTIACDSRRSQLNFRGIRETCLLCALGKQSQHPLL